jgi:2',3'-cyclic-nucleotide 2'-phosphodiesterase (5'-nucleotidase family)
LVAAAVALAACRTRDRPPPPDGGKAAAAAAATPAPPTPKPAPLPVPRGKHIAVLYSTDVLAATEACGCPVHPMGGLARRATQVDRARGEADATLVLDAGDLLLPAAYRVMGTNLDKGEIERRARLLASAFRRMGISAMTPGDRDLALGLPLLKRIAKDNRLPLLSANLFAADGRRLFDADRVIDVGGAKVGIKVGIFGVTAPANGEDIKAFKAAGIDARDAAAAARDEVASLRARGAAIVVALVHVGDAGETRKLLEAVPGVDWAVVGHAGLRSVPVEKVGTARVLGVINDGKELGRLDLHVVDGKLVFADRGERAEVETMLADHRRQLTDYDRRLGDTDPAQMREYYETRRKQVEAAIAREQALLERLPTAITGSWFESRIIPLDAETPDQTGVAAMVDVYNRESERRAAAGKPVGVGIPRPAPPATPATGTPAAYVGTTACGACHAPALAFWKTTKHARALAALTRVGRDRDPSCVGCHVTGYLQPGGWRQDQPAAQRTPLINVGCEACHGPGKAHIEAADKKASTHRTVATEVCRACHTHDVTNGEFDPEKFTAAILGPGHGRPPPL